ncbi:delta(3,5)-Delta(2,4)-dienoyl-CoA isomerase, mitochondrial [Diabrotica virgifera virgifera]|uniref:Delta(3,5)-Delta(2,4)-dienoyl-CoA isomerase, mitochondrial n=1 Tax=Diabrotica virgifera virgifera TaxID=50390 RepID=A0ABM5INT3_DIAVI|nr:delta(3,5)-Delta(2,4)-dienoyl-CoA isomerase, mitochondrial [Diabrotica virgifera virgifera]
MHGVLTKSSTLINLIGTSKMSSLAFKTLAVSVPKEFVYHVKLNRPEKRNAFNHQMWLDIKDCFKKISDDENCRTVVLSGEGKLFTAGIDLSSFMEQGAEAGLHEDPVRKAKVLFKIIQLYQESMSSLELCKKPVLAAIHSACIGAGVDLITAADIRYCTKDAYFQVKEVEVGLAADVGSLQRLPKVIGSDSLTRELCYTARKMHADEALTCGLVSRVFGNQGELIQGAIDVAEDIAKKSPVAVQATKQSLIFSRDHSVQEGLDHIKFLNQLNLQSEDIVKAATAQLTKDPNVVFSKL